MNQKMNFWEKLSYILGKDPLKKDDERYSPMARAVSSCDYERMDFFKKHCKLDPEKLAFTTARYITHPMTLLKLYGMGAKFDESAEQTIKKNIVDKVLSDPQESLYDQHVVDFLRENNVSLSFKDKTGKSIYDKMKHKVRWFEIATAEEISHEFRQAVANGNSKKVKEMISANAKQMAMIFIHQYNSSIYQSKVEEYEKHFTCINNSNAQGKTALMYAVKANDFEMAKFLYEHGASPLSKDNEGNGVFKDNSEMATKMMEIFAKADDVEALRIAAQAGGKFDNPNLALLAQKKETLTFLASKGAPLQDAILDADRADIRENTIGGEAAKRLALLRGLSAKEK